jgi:uncharacterized protein (UPF0332 family)
MSAIDAGAFIVKARESLDGASSECASGRYNNCANRAYYACFQAAVAALVREGIAPPGRDGQWRHEFVQARFVGDLINRRKHFPAELRETLLRLMKLRQVADYRTNRVSAIQAIRGLEHSEAFVNAVAMKGTNHDDR